MTVGYLVGAFPKVTETFILGEIAELMRQGVHVRVWSLRAPRGPQVRHPDVAVTRGVTRDLPPGPVGALRLLTAGIGAMLVDRRARSAARWALRATLLSRSPREVVAFARAAWLRRRLRGVDHLHAHFAHGPASTAFLVHRMTGVPFSFTAHACDIFEHAHDEVLGAKIRAAAFVAAISEHGRARLTAVAPDASERIVLVRNGIDLSRFAPRGDEPPGPGNGEPCVLAVSRLVEKKGLPTLVRAAGDLTRRGVALRVEVVGDGPLRKELSRLAEEEGVGDRVTFAGATDQAGVLAACQRATVFALPCQVARAGDSDGLPVSLVEAMAVGVPVVTTPIAGIPELVTDDVTGLLVPPEDPLALADALEKLFVDQTLRARLSAAGREAAGRYDRASWVGVLRERFAAASADPVERGMS